jgi:hypothetical protein
VQLEQTQQIVTFVEDGQIAVDDSALTQDQLYSKAADDGLTNSVVDFLARPMNYVNFTWPLASGPAAILNQTDFPSALLSRPMIAQKIAGFRYFRATLVIRLQVNAQPFNAGRLLLVWIPFKNSQSVFPSNEAHFGGLTGYRHIDLDLSDSTSVELRIPYMSPITHTDLITGFGEMGRAEVIVYSALTGEADVFAGMWAHFEDVSLEMPTGVPPFSFSSAKFPKVLDAQIKVPASVQSAERKAGDLETMFTAQTNLIGKMGKIPFVGEALSSLSWFTNAASGVAAIFGWSKPTNPSFETPMSIRYVRNYANFDGMTLAKPMGLDSHNSIIRPSGTTGTNEDEMALSTILQRPVFMDRFTWSAASTSGTIIWKWPVHPASCRTAVSGTMVRRDNTNLSFMSDMFKYWRGSINFHVKIVKTNFHSGRLRFILAPGADILALGPIDLDKCYTQIVDIRENTAFDINIPFISNRMFDELQTEVNITANRFNRGTPTSILYVEVLNELRVTGVAANFVEILVETSAGEDFQFAFMERDTRVVPWETTVPPVAPRVLDAQSKFFPSVDVPTYMPNAVSMGEAIVSVRQMLKRYCQISEAPTIDVTSGYAVVHPYADSSTDPTVTDVYSYLSHIYRLRSGGLKVFLANNTDMPSAVVPYTFGLAAPDASLAIGDWNVAVAGSWLETIGTAFAKFFGPEDCLELDIPWYQQFPVLPTGVGQIPNRPPHSTDANKIPNNSGTQIIYPAGKFNVSRAIGEDFSFGYLIGPPISSFTNV